MAQINIANRTMICLEKNKLFSQYCRVMFMRGGTTNTSIVFIKPHNNYSTGYSSKNTIYT